MPHRTANIRINDTAYRVPPGVREDIMRLVHPYRSDAEDLKENALLECLRSEIRELREVIANFTAPIDNEKIPAEATGTPSVETPPVADPIPSEPTAEVNLPDDEENRE